MSKGGEASDDSPINRKTTRSPLNNKNGSSSSFEGRLSGFKDHPEGKMEGLADIEVLR